LRQFQLRFCPTLAQKPKSSTSASGKRAIDPFQKPPEALFIADLGSPPSHFLLLNKFAIVPEHFILATKEYKEQTHLLEQDDLGAAFACLKAWAAGGKELFGFFNSGEHSGASQPHRHIQFLPVESMMIDVQEGDWHPLVDQLASHPHLGSCS
jgi:ATP adenylyltransferase